MPNATLRADARTMPERGSAELVRDAFDRAHHKWLLARAAAADPTLSERTDDHTGAILDQECDAEMALICTPAPCAYAIWEKWQILETTLTKERDSGPYVHSRAIIIAAAIKADILSVELKR